MKVPRSADLVVALIVSVSLLIPSSHAQTGAASIFQAVKSPNEFFNNGLYAVSASSTSDIWAVGQSLIHYDGTSWTSFPAPKMGGPSGGTLGGVVDFSSTNAWAVGMINTGEANPNQIIEQWDGTAWSVFPGPKFAPTDQPALRALTAISDTDMWAIGDLLGDDGQQLFYLFEHWDGAKWSKTTSLSGDAFLFAASADATNDVWAVGFQGPENDDSRTLAMHYNGTNWKQVTTPSVGNGANQLNGVLALAPNDVWAVGFSTPVPPPAEAATLTLIEHFDGTTWSIVPSPNVGPKSKYQSNRLFGLTANSPTDIWAFGSYFQANGSGHQATLLLHWDGVSWTIAPSPNPTNGVFLSDLLFAGVVTAPGDIWIVGVKDIPPHEDTLVIHTSTGASF